MTKKLTTPYLPNIKGLDPDQTIQLLEDSGSRQSIGYANWPDVFPYQPITVFNIARDDERIYVHYSVHGNCLRALYTEDQSQVWTDSCVEFFLQVPGDLNYFNFEFNCIGTCYAAKRESRANFTLLTSDELSQITRHANLGRRPFQEMQGSFNWDLLISIPFSLIGLDGANLPEKITGNFYKCADETALPHFLSWSPIVTPKPDFHCPEFFGEIYF